MPAISVTSVSPLEVRVNLPFATEASPSQHAGFRVTRGQVGEFVVLEGQALAIIGRITEIVLPDRERLAVEPERQEAPAAANPIGVIRLLGSVDLASSMATRGIAEAPRIGDYTYLAHPEFIRYALDAGGAEAAKSIRLGNLSGSVETAITIAPTALFGRHCAVLGSTGGGKSWTTARLVEEAARLGGKVLLIDPTGEYHSLGATAVHVHLGGTKVDENDNRQLVSLPHKHLSEMDLFALFQPSTGVQAPKLRDAIASLKLVHILPELGTDGYLYKQNAVKKPINAAFVEHDQAIRALGAQYDIKKLSRQIIHECVYPNGTNGSLTWGGPHENSISSCVSLCMRIESAVHSGHLQSVFAPLDYMSDFITVLDEFIAGPQKILRVSMQYLPFEHAARELVVNALGRHLLARARDGQFHNAPLVVALDEAHQFLNKAVGDEMNKVQLDAFGLIAKEGRKYGLVCLLATQRPRDIPEDVLSQVGTFVVHRLINERDQAVVVNASGAMDRSAAAFLPNLREGEALIVGNHTIMPLPVQMSPPSSPPHIPVTNKTSWMNR